MRYRDVVTVTPKVKAANNVGSWDFHDATPVAVSCNVYPVSADDSNALGYQPNTLCVVYCRAWPGGPYSTVTWAADPQPGRVWDQVGDPPPHRHGSATRHVEILISAQSGRVR